jgi:hypothetical protein
MRPKSIFQGIAILVFSLYFFSAIRAPLDFHLIDSVNLIFHEAGHTLLLLAPETLTVLGGSLFQILVPLVFVLYFAFRKEYFSSALLIFWLGYSIVNVSVYAGDAFVRQLPLLGGDAVIHDWACLSAHLGLGKNVLVVARVLHELGVLTMLVGLVWSLWIIVEKYLPTSSPRAG